jgi:hypothetical protein
MSTACPFNLSGVGVLIAGGSHIVLANNTVQAISRLDQRPMSMASRSQEASS